MKLSRCFCLAAAVTGLIVPSGDKARAAVVASEDFTGYTVGSQNLWGQGQPSTGFTGGWLGCFGYADVTASPVMTYPNYIGGGDTAITVRQYGTQFGSYRSMTDISAAGGTSYWAFLINYSAPTSGLGWAFLGNSSADAYTGGEMLGIGNLASGGSNWAVYDNGLTTTTSIPITAGVNNLAVVRIDWNANGSDDRVRLYINPNLAAGEGSNTPIFDNNTKDINSTPIAQMAVAEAGAGSNVTQYDGFRVATSWSDLLAGPVGPASTWTGTASTAMWSNSGNWSPSAVPTNGNLLFFSGAAQLNNTNDLSGLQSSGLSFSSSAGAFTLSGNDLTLWGSITNASTATQTVGMNLILGGGTGQSLSMNNTGPLVLNGVLSDGGSNNGITVLGPGTVTLRGSNTYGGGTAISAGALVFANTAAQPSSGTTTVANGATLGLGVGGTGYFTSANVDSLFGIGSPLPNVVMGTSAIVGVDTSTGDFTYSTSVGSVALGLAKLGANTLTLTGVNAYTGPTTINGGTLQVGNGGNGGTSGNIGSGTVTNNGTLLFNRSDDIAISNVVGGAGSLVKAGSGALTWSAVGNTMTGSIKVNAGILNVTGTGDYNFGIFDGPASRTWQVENGATLNFNGADSLGNVTTLAVNGGTVNINSGSATNSGNYIQAINMTGGLVAGNGLALNSAFANTNITVNASAAPSEISTQLNMVTNTFKTTTVTVNSGATLLLSGPIVDLSGTAATFAKAGPGLLILSGANTYADLTTINGGTLQIGNGDSSGNLGSGAVTNNSSLAFNRSDSLTVGNAINGSGGLIQAGAGSLILTAANAYGATTISNGILQVGNGGATGSMGTAAVTNNATLDFNRSNVINVANNIGGSGALILDAGTLALSGSNTYSGPTNVNAGVMLVNGTHAGGDAYTIASGATLGGTGTISGTNTVTLNSFAYLAPGNNIATGNVGTLTLPNLAADNATAYFDLSASTASGNDLLAVTGSLSLTGNTTIWINKLGPNLASGSYTLFTFAALSGAPTLSLGDPATLSSRQTPTFVYGANQITLDIVGNPFSLIWTGSGSATWDQDNTSNMAWKTSGGSAQYFANGDLVTFNDSGAINSPVNLTGTLTPSSVTVSGSSNYTFNGSGNISGATGLTKTGSGMLTIANTLANDYMGGTLLQGGTIVVGVNDALPAAGTLTLGSSGSNATLDLAGNSQQLGGLGVGAVRQSYARLRFHVGPGGDIELPVQVDYRRPFTGSDHAAWLSEYQANVETPGNFPLAGLPEPWDGDWIPGWERLFEQGGFIDKEHSHAV